MVRDKFRAYLNLKKKAVLTSPDLETVWVSLSRRPLS